MKVTFARKYISMESFSDWLLEELQTRDMTQTDLARLAGLGSGTISNIMTGTRKVGQDTLTKVAHALKLPPDLVFRKAGILPPKSEPNELIEQIMHEAEQLPEHDQKELLAFIRMKRNMRENA